MALYCQVVKILSSYVTPLKGDTLWGHVVWGISHHEGDEAVSDFLSHASDFVVSSAFPHGFLPRPMMHETIQTPNDKNGYALMKKRKADPYVPSSVYLEEMKASEPSTKITQRSVVTHNGISRETGSAVDGLLFSVDEKWHQKDGSDLVDVYVETSFSVQAVKQYLSWALENGFGADSSIGKGRMQLVGDPISVQRITKANHRYMALGPFVEDDNVQDLLANTFVRAGKLGGDFITSYVPFKKTVLFFDEGATFQADGEKKIVGRLLEHMHVMTDYNICTSGFAPVIEV